jgi:hypothetical protein
MEKVMAQFFNTYNNPKVYEMMKSDGIDPNGHAEITLERLYELSQSYDVTLRTVRTGYNEVPVWSYVFLALPTPFLPGPGDKE